MSNRNDTSTSHGYNPKHTILQGHHSQIVDPNGWSGNLYSPSARKSRKCKKSSQFRSRKTGYCRKRKCGSGRTRDRVTSLCRKKKSRRSRSRKSPKRKSRSRKLRSRKSRSQKSRSRKSRSRKSRSRKSSKRKSRSRKSRSRKSPKRKSRSRKPPCPSGMILNRSNGRCRVKCVPGISTRSRLTGRCRKIK